MTESYHCFWRRIGSTARWGLVAISVVAALLCWPNQARRIKWQISAIAGAVSHDGSTTPKDWLDGLDSVIRSNFSPATAAVTIDGVIDEALSQDQIVQGFTQLRASSTLMHVGIDLLNIVNQPEPRP